MTPLKRSPTDYLGWSYKNVTGPERLALHIDYALWLDNNRFAMLDHNRYAMLSEKLDDLVKLY